MKQAAERHFRDLENDDFYFDEENQYHNRNIKQPIVHLNQLIHKIINEYEKNK